MILKNMQSVPKKKKRACYMVRFYQIELSNLSLCKRQFRKDKDGKKIFREKIMERVSSPEQLGDYIRVTSPGMWMVMGAVVLLLASGSLVNLFAPLLIDTAMMVFYLAVMLRYSPLLTFVGVLSILCNLGLQKQTKRKSGNSWNLRGMKNLKISWKIGSTTLQASTNFSVSMVGRQSSYEYREGKTYSKP